MRLVKHSNPDAMPSMWPPDDQGRARDYDESGAPRDVASGRFLFRLGVAFVVALALYLAVTG